MVITNKLRKSFTSVISYGSQAFTTSTIKIICKDVIGRENRDRTLKVLKSLKPMHTGHHVPNPKQRAAVLVPLCTVNDEISMLLTIRSMKLKTNRGQVAFPGGKEDKADKTLEETALRETCEEVGLTLNQIDLWGAGPTVGRVDMMVSPYLGYIGDIDTKKLAINLEEVEKVFTVPLSVMCDPKYFGTTHFRSRHRDYTLPVFSTPGFRIWGLTAIIAHTMLSALLPSTYKNQIKKSVVSTNLPS